MVKPAVVLWDIGGVLLSNGWDHDERRAAADHFALDPGTLERRHASAVERLETGRLPWSEYVRTLLDGEVGAPDPDTFGSFVRAQSQPYPDALAAARELRGSGGVTMVALNNESQELNDYRIATFGLEAIFHAFLSSCYTGLRKPDPRAFTQALEVVHRPAGECLFLDDRPENVAAAAAVGIPAVRVDPPGSVRKELRALTLLPPP